ncbi:MULTISPECIES: copper resistance protein CopC [unclassified Streptomyces]|uniref:copper resistance CopC/CopD family protein n=1 Tax=unclassified Streptomyces TaxID=2593676 RepID=UPI001F039B4E|nr:MULTISPECIES: copper resistance protein CopC [unclassified Streptomyces]MCH0564467.1 copper resistance protein CopC/CopD [Streptomyces sp. MUM 2J]MCH0569320.1 copper resistance protein CopC/CopD [Streptomyces sp. MUM 136J]
MTRTTAPRLRALVVLLLAVAGALLAGASPASAHAALTGSAPAQGAVVDRAPDQVNLTFSEKVALNDDSLRVLDPRGTRVDKGDPAEVSGTTYAVQLRGGLPDGTYTVAYQVVSADSHPVSGAYTFSVGAPSTTTVALGGQEAGGGLVGGLYGFGRYVSYAGFVVLVGGAAFVLACWPGGCGVRAVQRLVVAGWLALTAATLGLLLLRGAYTTSGKASDILDLDLLGQVLQTRTGAALVSRLLLLGAAALFISVLFGAWDRREDAEKRDLTFGLALGGSVVAVGIAASWAMSEHASTGLQPGVAMPVDVVHLLAVAAWLGGLTALLVGLYGAPAGTPVTASAVRRFSTVAFGSVVALVATGTYQSWRQLGSWSALTGTGYGQLLLAKAGLVALLVAIASVSRRWTARLTDPAGAPAARPTPENRRITAPAGSTARARGDGEPADGGGGLAGGGADAVTADGGGAPADGGAQNTDGGTEDAGAGAGNPGGSARAAQLARQRAAVDAARRKRERDADSNRFGLRRSVLAEAGVAVVLLAVTTALTQTEPGRTEEAARAASSSAASARGALTLDMSFDTGGPDGKGVVSVDLDPARTGANALHVYVTRPDGRAYDIPEVKIAFSLTAKDLGPLPVVPDRVTTGHWSASDIQIPVAGDWKVAVTVRTSDIDQVTVSKNAQIG